MSVTIDDRSITLGLAAAHKIWVYDPQKPSARRESRRERAAGGAPGALTCR